jgi:hypothetical protein
MVVATSRPSCSPTSSTSACRARIRRAVPRGARNEVGVLDRALRTAWQRHRLGLPPRPPASRPRLGWTGPFLALNRPAAARPGTLSGGAGRVRAPRGGVRDLGRRGGRAEQRERHAPVDHPRLGDHPPHPAAHGQLLEHGQPATAVRTLMVTEAMRRCAPAPGGCGWTGTSSADQPGPRRVRRGRLLPRRYHGRDGYPREQARNTARR